MQQTTDLHEPQAPPDDGALADRGEVTLPGEEFTRRAVTGILATIAALTFTFSFGNIWALGLHLGVPGWIAPLVGPAVDLSVVGLLVGVRYLSMRACDPRQLRPARALLVFCGAATLALNVAWPIVEGAYGCRRS